VKLPREDCWKSGIVYVNLKKDIETIDGTEKVVSNDQQSKEFTRVGPRTQLPEAMERRSEWDEVLVSSFPSCV
jgi:hypothetical protein